MDTRVLKRSVTIAGHRTSVSLEAPFWKALQEIALRRGKSVAGLIREIDGRRGTRPLTPNLSSAIRVFVLEEALAAEDCKSH